MPLNLLTLELAPPVELGYGDPFPDKEADFRFHINIDPTITQENCEKQILKSAQLMIEEMSLEKNELEKFIFHVSSICLKHVIIINLKGTDEAQTLYFYGKKLASLDWDLSFD